MKSIEKVNEGSIDLERIFEKSNVPVAEILMGFMDREPDNSEVVNFLWKIRIGNECIVRLKGVPKFMMEAIKAVIVRLHAKRKTVAACDQTVATQQLLWRLDSQAALLEEHVNEYKSELERRAVEETEELRERQKTMDELRAAVAQPCCRRLADALVACDAKGLPEEELADAKRELSARLQRSMEELRVEDEKARAALREEQTQAALLEQLEQLERGTVAEMREWVKEQKRKHRAGSKGGGLGLFVEIKQPKRNNE